MLKLRLNHHVDYFFAILETSNSLR